MPEAVRLGLTEAGDLAPGEEGGEVSEEKGAWQQPRQAQCSASEDLSQGVKTLL